MSAENRIQKYLNFLYGDQTGEATWRQLKILLDEFMQSHPQLREKSAGQTLDHTDVMLITYGDQVQVEGEPPLETLGDFLRTHLDHLVPDVHILPFFPYSSDDGFAVIDYLAVNPKLGSWEDIETLGKDFKLMFDGVINHISRESDWFQSFLKDEQTYQDFFIQVAPETDLSEVFRPRALPLLTAVETGRGKRYVWTTFSEDQIDLNYANPAVLLKVLEIVLFYVAHQASFLRLDAIAFLWKIPGTTCLHLPQTHATIKLLRAILDLVAPNVVLITETNVPHQENISYFGEGGDEAQLVYNFALPPLVLHSFQTGDGRALSHWAADLSLPSEKVTFFNFLASHDGIGITPARGILTPTEIEAMVSQVEAHHGFVSYRNMPDGTQLPYELNINYFDALSDPASNESLETQINRFICAHAIMLALIGVPGIYFHSLFGSHGWSEGVSQTGMLRTINRQKLNRQDLERELANPGSLRARVLTRLKLLLQARAGQPAFGPAIPQRVLDLAPEVFAILRGTPESTQLLCLHNVSHHSPIVRVHLGELGKQGATELLSGLVFDNEEIAIQMQPYQVIWLELREV